MFQGQYIHTVDQKGRFSIPSRFRAQIGDQYDSEELQLTIFKEGEDRLLHLVPRSEWDRMLERIGQASQFKKKINDFRRLYVSGATECVPDKQGRIAIAAAQRDWAQIGKEVVVVGSGLKRLEVWDRGAWDRFCARTEDDVFAGIGEVLEEVGL